MSRKKYVNTIQGNFPITKHIINVIKVVSADVVIDSFVDIILTYIRIKLLAFLTLYVLRLVKFKFLTFF